MGHQDQFSQKPSTYLVPKNFNQGTMPNNLKPIALWLSGVPFPSQAFYVPLQVSHSQGTKLYNLQPTIMWLPGVLLPSHAF